MGAWAQEPTFTRTRGHAVVGFGTRGSSHRASGRCVRADSGRRTQQRRSTWSLRPGRPSAGEGSSLLSLKTDYSLHQHGSSDGLPWKDDIRPERQDVREMTVIPCMQGIGVGVGEVASPGCPGETLPKSSWGWRMDRCPSHVGPVLKKRVCVLSMI